MNMIKRSGLTAVMAIGLAVCAMGCVHTPSGKLAPDPLLTKTAAQDAALVTCDSLKAKYGTELDLTYKSLDAFVTAGGGSVADLQRTLQALPINVFHGTNSMIVVDGAALTIHQGQQEVSTLGGTNLAEINTYFVLPFATGFRDGLGLCLQK